jgi:ribosomal-protein-alanine acetyltransferase
MASLIQIGPMLAKEHDQVIQIQKILMPENGNWRPHELSALGERGVTLVARTARDEVIGMIFAQIVEKTSEILTFGVLDTYQRQGIGTLLLRHFFQDVQRRGVEEVFLDVRADNQIAVNLYKRHGFTIMSRRSNYYKTLANNYIDAIVMICHL